MQRRLLLSLVISGWTSFAVCAQKPALPEPPRIGKTAIDVPNTSSKSVNAYRAGFIENKGQLVDQDGKPNSGVKYLLQNGPLKVQLRHSGFSYDTHLRQNEHSGKFHRVDIELVGANPHAALAADQPGPAVSNVINERGEFRDVRDFQRVTYTGIYPGIDLEFVADPKSGKQVEYNFIVHPGADPARIQLRYRGSKKVALNHGRIVMETGNGPLREHIPASWVGSNRKPLEVSYKNLGQNLFAFQVPAYDKRQTLVIDPSPNLEWATYYGGAGSDAITAIDTDESGNVYAVGTTSSTANIASNGAHQGTLAGGNDFFIAKFNGAGVRQWATYYGGPNAEQAYAIAVRNGQVYIGGESNSEGLATAGAHQASYNVDNQLTGTNVEIPFLAKFDAATGQRTWASYYGGAGTNIHGGFIENIKVDAQGNLYALGGSSLNIFPLPTAQPGDIATPGAFRTDGGCNTSYLVKFNASGVRQWGTFIAGPTEKTLSLGPESGLALDLGSDGNIYVGGSGTSETDDAGFASGVGEGANVQTGYIGKFNGSTGARIWTRFFNSSVTGLKVDEANGRLHMMGSTNASFGIASPGAYRTTLAAARDAIWVSFDLAGHYLSGTYLGAISTGTNYARALDGALDGQGNLLIIGSSTANGGGLASECAYQSTPGGSADVFINKFNIATGQRLWGTYFGGAGNEGGTTTAGQYAMMPNTSNMALASDGGILLGFTTFSAALATPGSHQSGLQGTSDGMIVKFNQNALPADLSVSASNLTPMSQSACVLGIPGVITGNTVSITAPAGYRSQLYFQWQKADAATGPWQDIPGETFRNLQPEASQTTAYYRRLVKIYGQDCALTQIDSSQVAEVVIGANAAPVANADGPQWYVCAAPANTVTLNGSATGGSGSFTYQWFQGSTSDGTPLATNASWTTPAVTQATTYTLQVSDAAGCVDIDQVTIVPAVAAAGPAKSVCQGTGGVQIGTAPVVSPMVSYAWTRISGDPITTLSCTTCAQPIANPTVTTVYRVTVTVQRKGGGTCSSVSNVTVTPVAAPNGTVAFAGEDKTICKNSSVTLGGTADNTFAYTWTTGQYLNNSQVANPVFNAGTAGVTGGVANYTVTAVKTGCTFTDQVKVAVLNNRISDQDETVCGPVWSKHIDEDNAPGTTYAWSVVSGGGAVLQTSEGGKNAYLKSNTGITTFRRTVSLNGVQCSADVSVQPCSGGPGSCDFEIVTLSGQGCPKVFGGAALKLGTSLSNASDYNFSWSPANLVDNARAATVNITSTAQATITVTITNKYDASISCVKTIAINPPGWALPVFTAEDKYACAGTPVRIGSTPVAGFAYEWTPTAGLDNAAIANPYATVNTSSQFRILITETASGCKSRDTVIVNVATPVAAAGNDRTVCNGATITLGSAAPAGTNWQYAWTPTNAAWANGTGPTDAQPQVQFASGTPQTFTLTVTDPASGCTATDEVVLSNSVTAGEYAGAAKITCEGEAIELGNAAEPFAQYEWFLADGVTPATGLSSNTAANPTVLNPSTTTTYVVKVSYPGCATPIADQVVLTVNAVSALELTDKTLCPVGPIEIGYGAAGNPAAPAGATYAWSPATGLSNATAANPTATVTGKTDYIVTVTLASGCVFKDTVTVTPTANAGVDVAVCPGESVVIGTPAIDGATYAWTGAGVVGANTVAQPTVKPTTTTTYTVAVTVNGCTTTDQIVVTVNTPANFNITGSTAICEGGTTTLSVANPAVGSTWQWTPVAGVGSPNSPTTTITGSGTRTYRLTQTITATGCSNYKEVIVVVNPNTITATAGDLVLCAGSTGTLPLTVTSTGDYSYTWSPATGLSNAFVANPTVTANAAGAYTVTVTDNVGQCQLVRTVNVTINAPEACLAPANLSGNVFHDGNGLKDVTVNASNAQTLPNGLYVTLVNANGAAVKTVAVNADGTYDFGATAAGTYSIVLHQNAAGSTNANLPDGWINTGENLGAGVGSDEAVNGILTNVAVAGQNVSNANFGIQQPPLADSKDFLIDQPVPNATIALNGTHSSGGSGTSSPNQLTGNDTEDGTLNGSAKNRTVVITALPGTAELYYNGALVTQGQVIPNYDPALMAIKLTGTGYTNVTFEYAYLDEAGEQSSPVPYTVRWDAPLPVKLVSFLATARENVVELSWVTAGEANSDRFEVQRGVDGKTWTVIGSVKAAGESEVRNAYSFTDHQPEVGANGGHQPEAGAIVYRLKMIDRDSSFAFSSIRSVRFDSKLESSIYPNPVATTLNLKVTSWSQVKSVRIDNLSGIRVYGSGPVESGSIDVSRLESGVYIVHITHTDGSVHTHKFVHIQ
ncbi:Por secretion system C-terminal sorting domain-containing protein [Dyadobacter soli]|uniref:Por secretion system C-terminal sorting domain-containing protein n=1 Tax=Dyadobacter soli TaxID=659014 RepID=A0A1G7EC00_9BACT|nr:T9SS type A sorting domain-containing protein [Dyadobacter soli]SDE61189.1 Por secretion system C-terminal sorting domain-containing protein [Dyadobacter soli]